MKALFLDIDGVVCLHNEATGLNWGKGNDDFFDADCCRRLKEIIDITGCKIVLSSSWRLFPESIRLMFKQFKPYGITREDFLGKTPSLQDRGDEILAYIKKHPQIEKFVALDDEEYNSYAFPYGRLLLTKEESGITEMIKNKCIQMLI
ncbi:hypothetical protein ESZ91_02600 [Candidatus Borkfalkia ceftriaxoniphila]|uniref:FCP1 homology domain-containing protein n=1 Tax=Candidatus Borkfalkia ceftriaxoniphila TaxID=2508949 RepID=A0A4Q2K9J4_9FIRM|nr:HAD domain-containing protein [Candidatus Borkfalkia ceftriaxoniphila]RXZ61294.1 hypothetical protein ESZ91_02600 [Candidatus Borkfalkia ceftriaxoniphila]